MMEFMINILDDGVHATLLKYTYYDEAVTVPSEVAGYPLVGANRWAFTYANGPFFEQAQIKEITFSEGIRFFDHGVFANLSMLKKISLPSTLDTLYGDPFEGADNVEEIVFPNGNEHFVFEDGKLMSADRSTVYYECKRGN